MLLRREVRSDADAIRAVHTAAFDRNDAGVVVEAVLVDELRDEGDIVAGLSIVAEIDGAVVGHVVCSRGDLAGRAVVGLGPLGVAPAHQGRGVGSALMHGVLAAADALGEPTVVLLGDENYYARFGFVAADSLGVSAPDPTWGAHFQLRPLSNWTPTLRGEFRYAPAFDRL